MKLNFFFLLFIMSFNSPIQAQYAIKLNKKAPDIVITDWIKNIPKDKSFENKYIVLEFWATWCGPCIKAVPHLNELQSKFKRDDLLFISMTDEKVERVERSLKKVHFNSIVVSDQSKKTHIAFGNGKTGLEAYPLTILIDKSNTIKWIGNPEQLSVNILEEFLNDKLVPYNLYENEISDDTIIKMPEQSNFDYYKELVLSKKTIFAFEFWSNPNQLPNSLVIPSKIYLFEAETLKNILSSLLKINTNFIEIEPSLINEKYLFFYVNKKQISFNPTDVILEILNCNMIEIEKNIVINKVELVNRDLLIEAKDENESGVSEAGKKIIYSAMTLNDLIEDISSRTNIFFEANLDKNYAEKTFDFIIDLTDENSCLSSLKEYGFDINKISETRKFLKIEKK